MSVRQKQPWNYREKKPEREEPCPKQSCDGTGKKIETYTCASKRYHKFRCNRCALVWTLYTKDPGWEKAKARGEIKQW